jgi:hypothetical protein
MNDRTSAELEREAEATRERMADTAESIRRKLSAGQLIDEFSDWVTGGDVAGGMRKLKSQVADNPLPVALIGVGLAWLAFGGGSGGQRTGTVGYRSGAGTASSAMSAASSGTRSAAGAVSDTVGGMADSAKSAASSVSETVGGAVDSLSETADRLRHKMLTGTGHVSNRVGGAASDLTDFVGREPLVVAALGVGIGAAIGAMLPATEFEQEQFGPAADRLGREAKAKLEETVDQGMESARKVADETYEALKEEADREGLVPGKGKSVGERVGDTIKAAADKAGEATRRELGAEADKNAAKS